MNLTLAIEDQLVEKAREVARQQGTTLNAMIRDYIAQLAGQPRGAEMVARLEKLWDEVEGRSEPGWKFDREELYSERLGRYGRKRDDE